MRKGALFFAAFSGAVFGSVYLAPRPLLPWLALVLGAAGAVFLWKKRLLGWAALGLALGFGWYGAYRAALVEPALALAGRRAQVEVMLLEELTPFSGYTGGGECLLLREGGAPVRCRLIAGDEALTCGPGDRLSLLADCADAAYDSYGAPTRSDTAQGVYLRLVSRRILETRRREAPPWWSAPRRWGGALAQRIEGLFPEDVGGLFAALVTGDRSGLGEEVRSDLTRAGLSHLVAVSGMHLCFLVGLLALCLGGSPRRQAWVGGPLVVLFALAVGCPASVVRAAVMELVVLIAPLIRRDFDSLTDLALALFLLLLVNPDSAADPGLQLSFAAVAGITLCTPQLSIWLGRRRFSSRRSWARVCNALLDSVCGVLSVTLGAEVFTLPLALFYYGDLALAAPVTNLLVLPVAGFLFCAGLILGLWSIPYPAAAALWSALATPGARYVLWVARTAAGLPYSAVTAGEVYYPAFLLGLYGLGLLWVFWKGEDRRWWVFLACAGTLFGLAALFTRLSFRAGDLTVTVLNVGQGESVALSSGEATALIDCGGNRGSAGDVAADYFSDRGETRLDYLILTHFHYDHAGGLPQLFYRMDVGEVILPVTGEDADDQARVAELALREGAAVRWVGEDTELTLGQAQVRLYAPLGDGGANEEGLSALVSAGDFHLLLTGDMNDVVEEQLVRKKDLPRCQVLVAGHHGSETSSGDVLLEAIRPQHTVISVGENLYGHPDPATLARLEAVGSAIYRTDTQGEITVRVTAGE